MVDITIYGNEKRLKSIVLKRFLKKIECEDGYKETSFQKYFNVNSIKFIFENIETKSYDTYDCSVFINLDEFYIEVEYIPLKLYENNKITTEIYNLYNLIGISYNC